MCVHITVMWTHNEVSGYWKVVSNASGRGGSSRQGDVPRQQFSDAVDRVIGDAFQHLAKVSLWVEPIQLRRTDQGVHGRSALAAGVAPGKQVILPSKSDRPQSAF